MVALVQVLVRAAPGVVDAHRVVRRDRPVEEAVPPIGLRVAREVAGHRVALPPALDDLVLRSRHVQLAVDRLEQRCELQIRKPRPRFGTGAVDPAVPRGRCVRSGPLARLAIGGIPGGLTHGPRPAWRLRLGRDGPRGRCRPLTPSGLARGSSRRDRVSVVADLRCPRDGRSRWRRCQFMAR